MGLLYNSHDWNLPFPKDWFHDSVLTDKTKQPRGYLKISAHNLDGKKIYEFGAENQIMYWMKHSMSMLNSGIFFSTAGEHKGLEDGTNVELTSVDMPKGWEYHTYGGEYALSTHVWNASTKEMVLTNDISDGTKLYPFFPTKMRFGGGAPTDITTNIDPSGIYLEDTDARGSGNTSGKMNFIYVSREQHIVLTTTGYSTSSPSGYYSTFGEVFKNISVYQITMPASETSYIYDGETLNEAGLFCDASLTGTTASSYDQPYGMILAKRYFNDIQKTNTISINFQWSIVS